MKTTISENDKLHTLVSTALKPFSNLRAMLPPSFPKARKYNITMTGFHNYSHQVGKIWNHWNLPSVLWSSILGETLVKQLSVDVLENLEWFADKMNSVEGAKGVIKPLTNTAWNNPDDARIWEVISIVKLTRLLYDGDYRILGFERRIGKGNKKADILVEIGDKKVNIDIEMWHRPKKSDLSESQIHNSIKKRAEVKFKKDFVSLPSCQRGIIAVVCVLESKKLKVTFKRIAKQKPFQICEKNNAFAHAYFLLTSQSSGTNKLQMVDYSLTITV